MNIKIKLLIGMLLVVFWSFAFWWLWGDNFRDTQNIRHGTPVNTKLKPTAVSLAIGHVLVVGWRNNDLCAVTFNKVTHDGKVNYTSWFIGAGSNEQSFAKTTPKNGQVFENYWETRTGKDSYFVIDIGGVDNIDCGDRKLSWSMSTWIYYRPTNKVAVIDYDDFQNVTIANIPWHVPE